MSPKSFCCHKPVSRVWSKTVDEYIEFCSECQCLTNRRQLHEFADILERAFAVGLK